MATDTSTTSTTSSGTEAATGTASSATQSDNSGKNFPDHAPINLGNLGNGTALADPAMQFMPPSTPATTSAGGSDINSAASSPTISSSSSSTAANTTLPSWMSDAALAHHDWTAPSSTGTSNVVSGHDMPSGRAWTNYHPANLGGAITTIQS